MKDFYLYYRSTRALVVFVLFTCISESALAQKWYVNDNDLTGDRFTTAIGDDANPGTAAQPFLTIKKALSMANAGDSILVDAGGYVQDSVYITKSLTLLGAKYDVNAGPAAVPPGRFVDETEVTGTIYVGPSTDNVSIAGFYVKIVSPALLGINVRGYNIKVFNNITTASFALSGVQAGISMRVNQVLRTHQYQVYNNHVSGSRYGIYFDGRQEDPSDIFDNYVTGASVAGIVVTASLGHHFSGNVVEGNTLGFLIDEGNNLFERNTMQNNSIAGARLDGRSQHTFNNSFINNFFINNGTGIHLTNDDATAVDNSAHYNSFTGNFNNIINDHTGLFNATCNWYETIDPAAIAAKISGNILYNPFLVDGADTDPLLPGFQPNTSCMVIPVTLSSFTGHWQNKWAVLKWTTQLESNNRVFEIQRSTDGRRFTTIGTVLGAGNSNTVRHYQYNDEEAAGIGAVIYYRLKQVDFDGNNKLSEVVLLKNPNNTIFTFYPNPAHDVIFVKMIRSDITTHQYALINYLGQTIQTGKVTGDYFSIPVQSLPKGTYLIRLSDNTGKTIAQSVALIN